jgi:hypothetical protein
MQLTAKERAFRGRSWSICAGGGQNGLREALTSPFVLRYVHVMQMQRGIGSAPDPAMAHLLATSAPSLLT